MFHLGTGLGAVALQISTLCPSWFPTLGFSAKAGGFIYAFFGVSPAGSSPWGGPWDLWVYECASHYLEDRGRRVDR